MLERWVLVTWVEIAQPASNAKKHKLRILDEGFHILISRLATRSLQSLILRKSFASIRLINFALDLIRIRIEKYRDLFPIQREATALRNRQGFQRGQLSELENTGFESWTKESFDIATKIAYRMAEGLGFRKVGIWTAQ
jgi:hypothetical protein